MANQRPGYANVVETGSQNDEVWGLIYELTPEDEDELDINEGVPVAYEKRTFEVDFWRKTSEASVVEDNGNHAGNVSSNDDSASGSETGGMSGPAGKEVNPERVPMLVYIDFSRVEDSTPKKEYVYRMNQGIEDALKEGVPKEYIERVMRKFIPESDGEDEESRELALQQARRFVDDNTL